jgi:cytochrome c oxidase subunit 4
MAAALPDPVTPVTPVRHDDHAPGAPAYVVVWLALVALATATLFLSRAVTGGWGLVVALAIASAKAVLVAAFFMHLAHGRPTHRIVFAVAIGFLVLLVIGVLADVGTRSIASPYVDELGRPL